MYKRNIEPLIEFMNKNLEAGTWCVNCGYGKLYYYNKDVSCTIFARVDACGSTVLVEVEDEQESDRRTDNGNEREKPRQPVR